MAIEPLIDHYTVDLRDENNYYFAKDPQGDGSSRFLKITIEDNHEPYTLDPNNSYVMGGKNPAGYGVFISCEIDTTDNTLIIPLTDSVLADKGLGVYQIFIYSNSEPNVSSSLVTFPFNIFVIESPLDMNEMIRSNDYQELAYLINRANSFNGWYVGTGFPQIEDSKPGDYYLDQANGNIYVMDNNGWNVTPVGNIKMKTYVRYSHNSSGYPMTEHPVYKESNPSTYSRYVGFYCGTNNTAPSYSLFDWVYFEGPKGEKGDTGNNGQDGQDGQDGVTPNITATATINNNSGTPAVNVTKGGTLENPSFTFNFSNLKGDTGAAGAAGAAGRDVSSITMSGIGKVHPITATYSDGTSETVGTVRDGEDGQGSGDMTKAQYDTQNHGYVDASACVTDGINSLTYSQIQNGIQSSGGADVLIKDTVGWTGKNLLQNTGSDVSQGGVYYVVNTDDSVRATGTATANSTFAINTDIKLTEGDKLVLTGCPSGGSLSKYYIRVGQKANASDTWGSAVAFDYGSGVEFIVPQNSYGFVAHIGILSGQSTGMTFYPMLRKADIADPTYEPYHETVEQCKFDKAEQELIGVKNFLCISDNNIVDNTGCQYQLTETGIRVYVSQAMAMNAAIGFEVDLFPNTNYILTSDINSDYSGNANISIYYSDSNIWTLLKSSTRTDYKLSMTFNSGNHLRYRISIGCAYKNSTGDITYSNTILRLASSTDSTYQPFAMTNRQLTKEVLNTEEGEFISIISGATASVNHLVKWGKIVMAVLRLNTVFISAFGQSICSIPEGFKPIYDLDLRDANGEYSIKINTSGSVSLMESTSQASRDIYITATWITK